MANSTIPNIDFKPSELMRANRPELYSDSQSAGAYKLSRPVLSHHLSSLTERNEHKLFEEFCRALAQREICRNLRPQTGPEGGGDGKVDTETYPVAASVRAGWYEGLANSEGEKWAFAISAKKTWTIKVRSDVKGISETGRDYAHVHFFTNQNPRAKKRIEVEEELKESFGVPVTVYDRNWIEEKVMENGHADLAYDILGIGDFDPGEVRKGANDTARENELADIEEAIAKRDVSRLTDFDSVAETLRAAKLSRGLERPQYETDGRFERAIRAADQFGSRRQKFVSRYEKAWTCIWWFDDVSTAHKLYGELEATALTDGDCFELERLGNLLNVFVGQARHEKDKAATLKIDDRFASLREALERRAGDKQRPNHALYAETLLALHGLTMRMRSGESEKLDQVWLTLIDIVGRAKGLGEFPADLIGKMTELFTSFAPDSTEFDKLVIKVSEFMGERKKDGEQGRLLLRRGAQKLDAEKPLEAIVWLGRAAVAFNKNEYREEQVETLYYLAAAYQSGGLFWAARAASLSCLVTVSSIADEDGELPEQSIPATKLFCMICMRLGHIPDALQAFYLLRLYQTHMTLSKDGSARLHNEIVDLDQFLACCLTSFLKESLSGLSELPDMLSGLELHTAQFVLLYRLGYLETLREQEGVPTDMSDNDVDNLVNKIAAQPATKGYPDGPILNNLESPTLKTKILGVQIDIRTDTNDFNIVVAELLLASLEGFVSTMLNRGVFPQTPSASVNLSISDATETIDISADPSTFNISVMWPEDLATSNPQNIDKIQSGVCEFFATVVGLVSTAFDADTLFRELAEDELAFPRSLMFSNTAISHGRMFGREVSRLGDLPIRVHNSYALRKEAPDIVAASLDGDFDDDDAPIPPEIKRHTDVSVHTVINPHLWKKARWRGTAYASFGEDYPPIIGLMFDETETGKLIFSQLVERFGHSDEKEEIRVGIIKGVDRENPYHYRVHIAPSRSAMILAKDLSGSVVSLSRIHLMEPTSHQHLDFFQKEYDRLGGYFLTPVEVVSGKPKPIMDLRILKKEIFISEAWRIDSQHEDAPAVNEPEKAIVPAGEHNPPIKDLISMRERLRGRDT